MLETYEILDRYELLFSDNEKISDLRRSYIDLDLSSIFRLCEVNDDLRKSVMEKNLHSIFRLIDGESISGSVEDLRKIVCENNLHGLFRLLPDTNEELRKAVVEENLHSIFRFVEYEDLRKLILEDNTWKLFNLLDSYCSTNFTSSLRRFFREDIEYNKDCFSRGQLESKLWLVNKLKELNLDLGTIFLCAGWYATLATMLFESGFKIDKIRSFDIDKNCVDIAEIFNKPWFVDKWRFKSITQDIMDINYNEHTWQYWSNANNRMSKPITDSPDTIINTSCEHIKNFDKWYDKIPYGKLVILQSNNYISVQEHTNCVKSIKEFERMSPMTNLLYAGELELEKYTRYMLIGYR